MAATYKPDGHNSVSPYLVVDDVSRLIAFLADAFDAVELFRFEAPDGSARIMHAEVRIDDTVVMMGESDAGGSETAVNVHVYVPDVDATYRRALQAGGASIQEPVKKQDHDKRGGVKGPGGVTWWIATKVA